MRSIGSHFQGQAPLAFEFVGAAGFVMSPKKHPFTGKGEPKQCYRNAFEFAMDNGYLYAEGWASPCDLSLPVEHAWCYDIVDGKVIDPTWAKDGEYFGVPLDLSQVSAVLLETGVYGVLPNLFLMKASPDEVRWRLQSCLWSPEVPLDGQQGLLPATFEDKLRALKAHREAKGSL